MPPADTSALGPAPSALPTPERGGHVLEDGPAATYECPPSRPRIGLEDGSHYAWMPRMRSAPATIAIT